MSKNFDPMKELTNIRDQVGKVLEETFATSSSSLPLDIIEEDEVLVLLTGPLMGLDVETLDISITDGNQITISGETQAPDDIAPERYLKRERKFGAFSRTLTLPVATIAEEARANYKDGVLKITIPLAEKKGPKVIKVKPAD